MGAGGASKPSNKAPKPKAIRGAAAEAAGEAAVRDYLERFHRPCNCTQLWENTQRVVAKKEIVAACARLAAEGAIAVKEFQGGKVLLYYAEPDAMARKHGAFATPDALCDVCFDVLPETIGDAVRRGAQIISMRSARWRGGSDDGAPRRRGCWGTASMAWSVPGRRVDGVEGDAIKSRAGPNGRAGR